MQITKEDAYQLKVLEQRVEQGDLEAMYWYASLYQKSFPEEITPEIAKKIVYYYEKCIEAGNLTAALDLGAFYYEGVFVEQDFKKALKYYEMASESKDDDTKTRALCNLGYCYYYGRDLPQNDEIAYDYFLQGALLNDSNCLYKLGDMYRYGRFIKKDEKRAADLYKQALRACSKDNYIYPDICKRIGECALYGIGMKEDILMAFDYLSRAEVGMYKKIADLDPFAESLLPDIQKMVSDARAKLILRYMKNKKANS